MFAGGPTRRDVLRRGAVVAGAALYAAPVVQVIAMSPASAQTVSGPDTGVLPEVIDRPGFGGSTKEVVAGRAATPPAPLPFTGFDLTATAAVAAAAAGTGAAMSVAARKRAAQAATGPVGDPSIEDAAQ